MATAKRTSRSRSSDRSRVAGGQAHEVEYEARKTGSTIGDVKRAIKKAGSNMRGAVEAALGGGRKRTAKKSTARKSAAKKRGATKTGAKKTGARRTAAKKSAARKSTSAKRGGRKTSARKGARKSRA